MCFPATSELLNQWLTWWSKMIYFGLLDKILRLSKAASGCKDTEKIETKAVADVNWVTSCSANVVTPQSNFYTSFAPRLLVSSVPESYETLRNNKRRLSDQIPHWYSNNQPSYFSKENWRGHGSWIIWSIWSLLVRRWLVCSEFTFQLHQHHLKPHWPLLVTDTSSIFIMNEELCFHLLCSSESEDISECGLVRGKEERNNPPLIKPGGGEKSWQSSVEFNSSSTTTIKSSPTSMLNSSASSM